jgi:hypothetical protein
MKYGRLLVVILLALFLGGCGSTVHQSVKIQPSDKLAIGSDRTVVILPFADYSDADNLESSYRRNLFVSENVTDQFVRLGFHSPVQEDVFRYLAEHDIVHVVSPGHSKVETIESELEKDWSPAMKKTLQYYADYAKNINNQLSESDYFKSNGLTGQEIVKLGRHFSADYIVRGRIIQYKDRRDPSWSPAKRGVVPFFLGASKQILVGEMFPENYDNLNSMENDQPELGYFSAAPQAAVQIRIWVQDAYTGNVIWTNRANVQVSPQSFLADYQYDSLFETSTEKAISSLMNDFAYSVYGVPLPVEKKGKSRK